MSVVFGSADPLVDITQVARDMALMSAEERDGVLAYTKSLDRNLALNKNMETFDAMMDLYTEGFYEKEDVKEFVRSCIATHPIARVFVRTEDFNVVSAASVVDRVPVYMGRDMLDMYDAGKLEEITKKSSAEILAAPRKSDFCIGGDALVMGSGAKVGVVHCIGMNFESKDTQDYKRIVLRHSYKHLAILEKVLGDIHPKSELIKIAGDDLRARSENVYSLLIAKRDGVLPVVNNVRRQEEIHNTARTVTRCLVGVSASWEDPKVLDSVATIFVRLLQLYATLRKHRSDNKNPADEGDDAHLNLLARYIASATTLQGFVHVTNAVRMTIGESLDPKRSHVFTWPELVEHVELITKQDPRYFVSGVIDQAGVPTKVNLLIKASLPIKEIPEFDRMSVGQSVEDKVYNRTELWLSAASSMSEGTGWLRLPCIGFGAYATELDDEMLKGAMRGFQQALCVFACKNKMTIELCDYAEIFSQYSTKFAERKVVYSSGPAEGNLFKMDNVAITKGRLTVHGKPLVLLNAWDTDSFVGNGGRQDHTVDGFMVAGHGPNKQLLNTSYLHNPLLNPHMRDKTTWVKLPSA